MASRKVGLPVPTAQTWMLEAAGLTRERMGELVAYAVRKTQDQLEATRVQVFQHEGCVVYADPMPDHVTQGKAAERVLRHFLPRIQQESERQPAYILPPWAYGEVEGEGEGGEGGVGRVGEGTTTTTATATTHATLTTHATSIATTATTPPPSTPPPSVYLPLSLWGKVSVFPYGEVGGVGGKMAGPLSGVHVSPENLGGFETLGGQIPGSVGDVGNPSGNTPSLNLPGNACEIKPSTPITPNTPATSVTPPPATPADISLYTDETDDPPFRWLDEVRR